MSFTPVIPSSGYSGWVFLNRTADTQKDAFRESAPIQRATDAFASRINEIRTAEELVSDREVLAVALGAFGLEDDINNTFFIRKVLEEGTIDPKSLANRLADPRYADLSDAFGFETGLSQNQLPSFADKIIDRYEARQFERAIGEINNNFRLALNFETGLNDILSRNRTDDGRWFAMMGNAPLRNVFQTSLGFPQSFSTLDLDKQLEQFRDRSRATFDTEMLVDFQDPTQQEKIIRLFLLRSDAASITSTSTASVALTLLRSV